MRTTTLAAMILAVLAGCDSSGDADLAMDHFATRGAFWTATSTSGREVRVQAGETSLTPGRILFRVHADAAPVLSADLVSPSMPNHGIVRLSTRRDGVNGYLVDSQIPMSGDWVLYVNLDDGWDTAEFPFEVSDWPR